MHYVFSIRSCMANHCENLTRKTEYGSGRMKVKIFEWLETDGATITCGSERKLRRKRGRVFRPNPPSQEHGITYIGQVHPEICILDTMEISESEAYIPLPPDPPRDILQYLFAFEAPITRLPPDDGEEEFSQMEMEDMIVPWPSLCRPSPPTLVRPTSER